MSYAVISPLHELPQRRSSGTNARTSEHDTTTVKSSFVGPPLGMIERDSPTPTPTPAHPPSAPFFNPGASKQNATSAGAPFVRPPPGIIELESPPPTPARPFAAPFFHDRRATEEDAAAVNTPSIGPPLGVIEIASPTPRPARPVPAPLFLPSPSPTPPTASTMATSHGWEDSAAVRATVDCAAPFATPTGKRCALSTDSCQPVLFN